MIFEIDRETVKFISSKKLTFNQFAICLLIYQRDLASLIQYTTEVGHIGDCLIPIGKLPNGKTEYAKEIDDLVDRGFLKNTAKNQSYDLDNFIVTTKFTKGFVDEYEFIAKEAFEAYPKHIFVNGDTFEAKTLDYDEFAKKYIQAINGSVDEHKKEVMPHILSLRKAVYAKMKIMNYVGSRNWKGDKVNEPKSRVY